MEKQKKEYHPLGIRIDSVIYERLQRYCESSGQSKTVAIERALKMYIDDYEDKLKRLGQ